MKLVLKWSAMFMLYVGGTIAVLLIMTSLLMAAFMPKERNELHELFFSGGDCSTDEGKSAASELAARIAKGE